MDKRKKQEEVFIELVNLQLQPFGKTYKDVKGDPEWYMKFKTSREEIIRKKLRLSKRIAEQEMSWFVLQWGLTTVEAFEEIKVKADKIIKTGDEGKS
jgi:hypothetical protein